MVGGQHGCSFRLGTEGIDPGVDFHIPFVAFLHHPCQRVPSGVLALRTGKEAAPGLIKAGIEGIGLAADLEHDGVDACRLANVELMGEALLHLLGAESLELSVDALYPCPTKFTLGRRTQLCRCGEMAGNKAKEKKKRRKDFLHGLCGR